MKKKLNLIKNLTLVIACTFLLTGCASMSYVGSDYDALNQKGIQTSAGFYFSTYKKTSALENIDMSVGITKSAIPDVYMVYIGVDNNNDEDYVIYQRDFSYSANEGRVRLVSASEYINAFQSQETGSYAGMQSLAPTISNIATIANNFQPTGQENVVYQQNTRDNLENQIGGLSKDIVSHTITSAVSVGAKSKKYFYNFIETEGATAVSVNYKDLEYKFGTKQSKFRTEE